MKKFWKKFTKETKPKTLNLINISKKKKLREQT
jgi:hypothetical protein